MRADESAWMVHVYMHVLVLRVEDLLQLFTPKRHLAPLTCNPQHEFYFHSELAAFEDSGVFSMH
jgi:hypothetical protein